MRKGQSWSMDIVIAVTLFIGAALTFFAIYNSDEDTKFSQAQDDAQQITELVSSDASQLHFVSEGSINESKIVQVSNLTFEELQRLTGVGNEFCIFFEDQQGNVVLINNSVRGIGSKDILIGGQPCT